MDMEGHEGDWESSVAESKEWEEDYKRRKDELEARWKEEAETNPPDEWKRLNLTDKARYMDSFEFKVAGRVIGVKQGIANHPTTLGLTIWDGSQVLSKYLERCVEKETLQIQGKRGIEIGCGCGLVSLAAAVLGMHVVASDLKWIVPLAQINAERNAELFRENGGTMTSHALCWGKPEDWADLPQFDYILAADCVYVAQSMGVLLDTIYALANDKTEIIFAFQNHNNMTEQFWAMMPGYFTHRQIAQEDMDEKFRDPNIAIVHMKKKPRDSASA